jgi:hypothetical protein
MIAEKFPAACLDRNNLLWTEVEMTVRLVMNDMEKSCFSYLKTLLHMVFLTYECRKMVENKN